MPSEVVLDTTLTRVAPVPGEEALGKWRAPNRQHRLGTDPGSGDNLTGCRAGGITMLSRGGCGRALEPRATWEGPPGKAAAANRTREIRPSGMRGGLAET
jgi:hypothetical protein